MFTKDADGLRAFLRDVLGFASVDAGVLGLYKPRHPTPISPTG